MRRISFPRWLCAASFCNFCRQRGGLINVLLNLVGIESRNWITYPSAFRHIYVWSGVWQGLGYSSIIYIAALSAVPPDLHEAAIVDGANIVKRIWHVDIPCVLPTFCILLIMRCGSILNVGFQKVLLLQNNLNLSVSEIISTYTYNIGLNSSGAVPQYSYGAAIGLFTSVVNLVLLVIVNAITKRLSGKDCGSGREWENERENRQKNAYPLFVGGSDIPCGRLAAAHTLSDSVGIPAAVHHYVVF